MHIVLCAVQMQQRLCFVTSFWCRLSHKQEQLACIEYMCVCAAQQQRIVQTCAFADKPAEDFQQFRNSIEVLSFIYEPEGQRQDTHRQKHY